MHPFIYPALFCATSLLYATQVTPTSKLAEVQPLSSVTLQNNTTGWKQANQKVAELGGWQFYASQAGGHQGMDQSEHSEHSMPMDHSTHQQMDHSKHSEHSMPVDHSSHQQMDHSEHSEHSMPMDHSNHQQMDHSEHSDHSMQMDHSNHQQKDHSKHSEAQPAKTGDEHAHHH